LNAIGARKVPDQVEQLPAEPEGRWRALAILGTAMVFAMTTWFSATAVLPQLKERWDLDATEGSWLTISVQLGFVAGAIASAALSLADLVPPRRLFLYGALGAAAANLALLAAGGLGPAIGMRFLTGVFLAAVYPPALKAMATWFRRGRGTALGVLVGALTLGSALPHLVNGLGGIDWQAVIIATSILTAIGGLIAEIAGRDGPYSFPRTTFAPRQAGRAFSQREVLLASGGYFGHMWELYAMWAWFAAFMGDTFEDRGWGDSASAASLVTFIVIGLGAVGSWVGGVIGDRWGRAESTILAMAISGACAATIGFITGTPLGVVIAVGLVWGFWVVADSAQFSTLVTEVADQRYVGTSVTLQLAVGFTLTVITIWLVPVIRDAAGWGWAFLVLAPGPMLGIASMIPLTRSRRAGTHRPLADR
jgi:MFS family permease